MNPTTQSQVNRVAFLFAAVSILWVAACSDDVSAPAIAGKEMGVVLAKVTSTTDMSVTSTSPDSATQDTTLDVVINGSGFVSGTSANWALAGLQDSTQVRTNSTRYVSSRQLVANITISASATVGKWDVIVTAAGKKGGIGTEAFAIKSNSRPIAYSTPDFFFTNSSGYALRGDSVSGYLGDGVGVFDDMSRYRNNECGVDTNLFDSPSTGSGDATFGTGGVDRRCKANPRGYRITYLKINSDGSITNEGTVKVIASLLVAQIQPSPTSAAGLAYIPVGSTESRPMNFMDNGGKCSSLRLRAVLRDGRSTGADLVLVTRTAADTWVVTTAPDEVDPNTGVTIHHDKAWCEKSGLLYHMPVSFVIHNSVPLLP